VSLSEFSVAVVVYCLWTRASVVSGIRTAKRNGLLPDSVPHSGHLWGMAVDVVYDDAPPEDGAEIAKRLGMTLLREHDHDHLQPLGWIPG
jgi:hypothetical protein